MTIRKTSLAAVLLATCGVAWLAGPAVGADVGFSAKPKVAKAGDQFKISFAVSAATDVEVAILDGGGKVVRHLAAGVLDSTGKSVPPEPLRPGLAQEITWDGADDASKPLAETAGLKVRVALGLRPTLDGFLLHNPDAIGNVRAMTTDKNGRLLVMNAVPEMLAWWTGFGIKAFNRQGHYERTLMPFPADIDPKRLAAAKPFLTADGQLVPQIHHGFHRSFYPYPDVNYIGCCYMRNSLAVDGKGRVHFLLKGLRIASIDLDGGLPYAEFFGPKLLEGIKDLSAAGEWTWAAEHPRLAASSDGKWLYLSGLRRVGTGKTPTTMPCVYRIDPETRTGAEVFVGDAEKSGGKALLAEPRGIFATGGMLYVADTAADRIAIFKEADRSFVGEVKLAKVETVAADPRDGTIYAITDPAAKIITLAKLSALPAGKEVARLTLPGKGYTAVHLALDATVKDAPPVLWLGLTNNSSGQWIAQDFLRVEDAGDSFSKPEDPRDKSLSAEGGRDLNLERVRGELYFKPVGNRWMRLEEKTGKVITPKLMLENINLSQLGTQLFPAADGNLYAWSWFNDLARFDRDGKKLNWPGQSTANLKVAVPMSMMNRYLWVNSAEEMFAVVRNIEPTQNQGGTWYTCVDVLGPEGKAKRTVIWECGQGATIRLDAKGNIYLADVVKPAGRSYPEFFDGKIERPKPIDEGRGSPFWNSYLYGSIIKFPSSGGAIWFSDKVKGATPEKPAKNWNWKGEPPADLLAKPKVKMEAHVGFTTAAEVNVQNASWIRFGYSPLTMCAGNNDTCMCEGSRFDVDLYGRVFYPNLAQFRIEMLDNNGNPIGQFGSYGNEDSIGPAGAGGEKPASVTKGGITKPAIPLAWPITVAVSDTHAYVGDTLSRRLAKVRLAHAVEEVCEINAPAAK